MAHKNKRLTGKHIMIIAGGAGLLMVCLTVFVFSVLISDEGPQRKRQTQMVTLLPPPPPPKIEEQPPEPEEQKEKIAEPEPEEKPNEPEDVADDLPPAEELGLDADAGLGSDAFGLKAKKGGRGLIGGNGGSIYGWYTGIISADLQKLVNKIIQERGGVPEGKWRTIVRVVLDEFGNIKTFSIIGSSGNDKMDGAVLEALKSATLGETPPPGMPRVLKLSFSARG